MVLYSGQVRQVAGIRQGIEYHNPVVRMSGKPVLDEVGSDKAGSPGYQQPPPAHTSILQRQCDSAAIACRLVRSNEDLEGVKPFAAVGVRHGFSAEGFDDVVVVQWMTEAID